MFHHYLLALMLFQTRTLLFFSIKHKVMIFKELLSFFATRKKKHNKNNRNDSFQVF